MFITYISTRSNTVMCKIRMIGPIQVFTVLSQMARFPPIGRVMEILVTPRLESEGVMPGADKRGMGCAKKTSGLWGYPMPGFATLNPAYRTMVNN